MFIHSKNTCPLVPNWELQRAGWWMNTSNKIDKLSVTIWNWSKPQWHLGQQGAGWRGKQHQVPVASTDPDEPLCQPDDPSQHTKHVMDTLNYEEPSYNGKRNSISASMFGTKFITTTKMYKDGLF